MAEKFIDTTTHMKLVIIQKLTDWLIYKAEYGVEVDEELETTVKSRLRSIIYDL